MLIVDSGGLNLVIDIIVAYLPLMPNCIEVNLSMILIYESAIMISSLVSSISLMSCLSFYYRDSKWTEWRCSNSGYS